MTRIWVMRHAPTVENKRQVYMGGLDCSPLPEGIAEAERFGRDFDTTIDRVIASPLSRALQTAAAAFPDRRIDTDARLAERRLGAWEGLRKDAVRQAFPAAFLSDGGLDLAVTPPGGETVDELYSLVAAFILDEATRDGHAFVVTHNGVIRMMRYVLGLCDLGSLSRHTERFLVPACFDISRAAPVRRGAPQSLPPIHAPDVRMVDSL